MEVARMVLGPDSLLARQVGTEQPEPRHPRVPRGILGKPSGCCTQQPQTEGSGHQMPTGDWPILVLSRASVPAIGLCPLQGGAAGAHR